MHKHLVWARQVAGYTFYELTVAMAVVTGLVMTILSLTVASTESLRSSAVAQQYRMLNQAVATYMGRHHAALSALPADCSRMTVRAQEAAAPIQANCQLNGLSGQSIQNGLQPTPAELMGLHLLEDQFDSHLILPFKPIMQTTTGQVAKSSLAVQISIECAPNSACDKGYRLTGLVFNVQPYDFELQLRQRSVRQNILEAFTVLGGSAALALPTTSTEAAELVGYKNLFQLKNPLRSSAGGVPGVLAMRSDYNSLTGVSSSDSLGAYSHQGQLWDFTGQSLRGISSLAVSSMGANDIKTNRMTVHGLGEFQALSVESLSSQQIKLPSANLGSACVSQVQSVATSADGSGGLLVCNAAGQWILYQTTPNKP